jgi:hypothetical protein
MAKSKNNVVTRGLSGKIGNMLVFRQMGGETIVSTMPQQSSVVTEKQLAHRKRFQQAVLYGTTAIESPETKELYETAAAKEKRKPFNVAVADFFHAPDIDSIDISEYSGKVGDRIRIIATDDFAVKSVTVRISNADGSLVEEGEATQSVGTLWIYTATQNNENLDGDKIVVIASDLPGNLTNEELKIENNRTS